MISKKNKLIKFLNELTKKDVNIAGGKGANLGEMWNAKIPVPNAFVITAEAYKKFIEENKLKEKIFEILSKTDINNIKELEENSRKIREMILNADFPKYLKDEIKKAYEKLSKYYNEKELTVIVRSSATLEDVPEASFAGQQETILNVKGFENLLSAIKRSYASLFTARVISYRTQKNLDHSKAYMSVIVQKQLGVLPKEDYLSGKYVAGIAFTIHPVTSEKNKIVIEASYGQGEEIVSGAVTPDTYVVDKKTLKILEKKISDKNKMKILIDGKVEEIDVPVELAKKQALSDNEIIELAKILIKIEKHYKFPQDVEWVYENGKFYIVQARPVTAFFEKKAEEIKIKEKPILIGLPASPGIAIGKVKKVLDLKELHKVEEGDILVTIMTNPDMVPAMKKAKAIVTDEGGMTCLSGNTKLITNYGILSAKEIYNLIKDGKNVFLISYDFNDKKLKWKKIIAAGKRIADVFKVYLDDNENFVELTADHKIPIIYRKKARKIEIKEIVKKGLYALVPNYIPEKPLSIKSSELAKMIARLVLENNLNYVENQNSANTLVLRLLNNLQVVALNFDFESVKEFFNEILNSKRIIEIDDENIKEFFVLMMLKIGLKPNVQGEKLIFDYRNLEQLNKRQRFSMLIKDRKDVVYNFEIDEENEINKNYVVLTSNYIPIIVSNSHAAIVSREFGIPCVVGTKEATKILKDNQEITVDGYSGKVYLGKIEELLIHEKSKEIEIEEVKKLKIKTKILMNLGVPEKIKEYKHLPFDGIGLMRIEFIIGSYIREHPLYLIEKKQEQKFIDKLAEGIALVAKEIYPRFVVVRFSDFKTNEYAKLIGGEKYEPKENNPMLGWRGVSRYISKEYEKAFRLECKAIKKVREEYKLKNVWVMLPFVRTTWEVEKVLKIMEEEGLKRSKDFKVWLMAEVPSNIFLADEFCKLCDGFSIGSNDLTQLILGADRDSEILAKMGYFDERNEAVKRAIKMLIETAHKYGKTVSICGQAPSVYPEFTEFLVSCGIDSISVNPDVVVKTRKLVYELEKKLKR